MHCQEGRGCGRALSFFRNGISQRFTKQSWRTTPPGPGYTRAMRIAIDIRRLYEFGLATYIRNVVRTLGRIDLVNEYYLSLIHICCGSTGCCVGCGCRGTGHCCSR